MTARWPGDREKVIAGRLTLGGEHEDQDAVERMVFDPTGVPPGIGLFDDPILRFRSEVYRESHARRVAERRAQVEDPP